MRLVPAQEIALLAWPALPAGPTCTKPKTVSVTNLRKESLELAPDTSEVLSVHHAGGILHDVKM